MEPDAQPYRELYNEVYRRMWSYGTAIMGHQAVPYVVRKLQAVPDPVLVDVGGGKGGFAGTIKQRVPHATVYSTDIADVPVPPGVIKVVAPAWDLSAVEGKIDVLTSFDMLEHLYEPDIDPTLAAWADRLRGAFAVTVGTRSSMVPDELWPGGPNLHQTIKPHAWWAAKLCEHFDHAPDRATIPELRLPGCLVRSRNGLISPGVLCGEHYGRTAVQAV